MGDFHYGSDGHGHGTRSTVHECILLAHKGLQVRVPWFVVRLSVTVTMVAILDVYRDFCAGLEPTAGQEPRVDSVESKIMPMVTAPKAEFVATSHARDLLCDDPINGQDLPPPSSRTRTLRTPRESGASEATRCKPRPLQEERSVLRRFSDLPQLTSYGDSRDLKRSLRQPLTERRYRRRLRSRSSRLSRRTVAGNRSSGIRIRSPKSESEVRSPKSEVRSPLDSLLPTATPTGTARLPTNTSSPRNLQGRSARLVHGQCRTCPHCCGEEQCRDYSPGCGSRPKTTRSMSSCRSCRSS